MNKKVSIEEYGYISFNRIIEELERTEYHIHKQRLQQIANRKPQISIVDLSSKKIENEFCSEDSSIIIPYTSDNIGTSHILEYPPMPFEGRMIEWLPIINLMKYQTSEEFQSSVYHELSHLFSSSKWKKISGNPLRIQHVAGINIEEYEYKNNEIEKKSIQKLTLLDELINDFIAMFLYNKIENKPYFNHLYRKEFDLYLMQRIQKTGNGTVEWFIGKYFLQDLQSIEEILIKGTPEKSLKELEKKFHKRISKERD